ncbi:MAG: peptidylprolyl isomerase [Flavobacteriales bacterium]|nr:peptidylprolyl isomerase [Flavobacteriales bacterium]
MVRSIIALACLLLIGCESAKDAPPPPPNRWADERLGPVLDAQEHRDTDALCALLEDTSATVREAAALAFASVQDKLGLPCLLGSLSDPDPSVRRQVVFALGLVADSAAVQQLAEASLIERDTLVQRAFVSASLVAVLRNGMLKDMPTAVHYLERSSGQDRVRAADALRRLPQPVVNADSALLFRALEQEKAPEVRAYLLRALVKARGATAERMLRNAARPGVVAMERIAALQSLGHTPQGLPNDALLAWSKDADPAFRAAVHGVLAERTPTSSQEALRWLEVLAGQALPPAVLAGDRKAVKAMVDSLCKVRYADPYQEALRIRGLGSLEEALSDTELEAILYSERPAVERQAAFGVLAQRTAMHMRMPRAISFDMQLREAAPFWHRVFACNDAGLICAAAEQLAFSPADQLAVLFPAEVQQKAAASLHPIRDLEAVQLIEGLAAKRDGRTIPTPMHSVPSFNHPIDPTKLRALKQGQRYRITTDKGTIILSTDVNDCPGSSLVFDSLVTAGYYNGKAFHRMVPNFVVQGGCPRGDGYGGMPWTLRTEIGRTPFSAGSVGLASAGRDTESCQFFITHVATPHLDGRYTRFGEVVEGMDVVWRLQVGDVMQKVERVD